MTALVGASATHPGRVRSTNEDLALVEEDLVAVADGMGGHAFGEVAAETAVETLRTAFASDRTATGLVAAASEANRAVYDRSEAEQDLRGMGTTLTAAAIVAGRRNQQLALINVGDSRAYLFADGELTQLTEDHSLVEEMRRRGEISQAQAASHPRRNILTRALGIDPDVEVDSWLLDIRPGTRLLLCSDGLTNECGEEEIAEVLATVRDPAEAARVLVARALDHGGNDNITAVIADFVDEVPSQAAPEEVPDAAEKPVAPKPPSPVAPTAAMAAAPADSTSVQPIVPSRRKGLSGIAEAPMSLKTVYADDEPRKRPRRGPIRWSGPRHEDEPRRHEPGERILTTRVIVFAVVLIVLLGGIIGVVTWFVKASYFIGLQGSDVVIFQGRPGGLLWIKPTVVERTSLNVSQVFAPDVAVLQSGMLESSLAKAQKVVSNLTNEQRFLSLPTTTTLPPLPTTLPPASTSTTGPAKSTTTTSTTKRAKT